MAFEQKRRLILPGTNVAMPGCDGTFLSVGTFVAEIEFGTKWWSCFFLFIWISRSYIYIHIICIYIYIHVFFNYIFFTDIHKCIYIFNYYIYMFLMSLEKMHPPLTRFDFCMC